jgi:hypothetical protein
MLNDSQKTVFRGIADNKATFECLKEYLEEMFSLKNIRDDMTNEEMGAIARAKLDGQSVLRQAFIEIASCKTQETPLEGINPAR